MIRKLSSSRVHVEDVLWRLRRNCELDRLYRNVQRSPHLRGYGPTWTCSLSRRLLFPGLAALTAMGAYRVGVIWGPNLLQRPKPQPEAYSAPFPTCAAVRAAGRTPLYRGSSGYGSHLDRDNDGIACEAP